MRVAGALLLCGSGAGLRVCGGGAFAMAALAPQRLVGGCRRRTATPVRVIDAELHVLLELLEEEGALESHLLDATVQTADAYARAIVTVFNVGYAPSEINAFLVVSFLHRRREVCLGKCPRGWTTLVKLPKKRPSACSYTRADGAAQSIHIRTGLGHLELGVEAE